jgi:hypothetical protein
MPLQNRQPDAIMERMSKEKMKRHQEELQQRILELIQDFELKTDWRVESVAYNTAASTVRIAAKQPPH